MVDRKQVTEVVYETVNAIRELDKLDGKVKQSGQQASEAFGKGTKSSKAFELAMGKLPGRASSVLSEVKGLGAAFGPLSVAVVAAVGAFASLAGELLGLPEASKDTVAGLEAINKGLQRQLELRNLISGVGDARRNRQFFDARVAIEQERAELARREFSLRSEKNVLQERLDANLAIFDRIDERAKQSVETREGLEDRLTSLINKAIDRETSKLPIPQQILKLIEQADVATGEGDLDRAEQLIDRAFQLADRSGDQSGFFNRRIEDAEGRLAEVIEDRIDARKREEASLNSQLAKGRQLIDQDEARKKAIERQELDISTARVDLERRTTENQLAADAARFEQQAQEATRNRAIAHQQITNILETERSKLEKITDLSRLAFDVINPFQSGGAETVEQIGQVRQLKDDILEATQGLSNRTTEDDQTSARLLDSALERYNDLRKQLEEGTLTGALRRDLDDIEKIFNRFPNILKAGQRLEEAGQQQFKEADEEGLFQGASTNVKQASEDAELFAKSMERAANASERINIPAIAPVGVSTTPTEPTAAAATAPPTTQAASTINVNAEVKGGLIDPETIRTITDLIKRQLRAGTVA